MVKQARDLDIPGNWCTAPGIFHIPGMVITLLCEKKYEYNNRFSSFTGRLANTMETNTT